MTKDAVISTFPQFSFISDCWVHFSGISGTGSLFPCGNSQMADGMLEFCAVHFFFIVMSYWKNYHSEIAIVCDLKPLSKSFAMLIALNLYFCSIFLVVGLLPMHCRQYAVLNACPDLTGYQNSVSAVFLSEAIQQLWAETVISPHTKIDRRVLTITWHPGF